MRQNIALFFFFGLAGSLFDRMWVVAGTLEYPGPGLQPWWIPLQYGVMGLIAVHAAAWLTRLLIRRDAPPAQDLTARFAISASWFVLAELAGGLFDSTFPRTVAATLVGVWLIRIMLQGDRMAILAVTLSLGIAGTLGEALMVRLEWMSYTRPDLLGLPYWIPGLWLQAGFLARDIGRGWFGGR